MLKNISRFIFIVLAIFIADASALFLLNFFQNKNSEINNPDGLSIRSERVLGESDQSQKNSAPFSSEDFKIEQLALGGEMADQTVVLEDSSPLKIYDVSSEVLSVKDNPNKTYLVVSWKTNKATQNELKYARKGENASKNAKEADFSVIHTLILPDLEPDSVYEYSLVSRDHFGNEKTSDQYMAYSGAPNVSLVDVLQGAAEKVFGWAIKK
jgi:hypothetical protein